MDLKTEIKKLEQVHLEKPQRVFTMYLNTDPSDPEQQGGEWRIHLKNGLNNFESYLQQENDSEEKRNFAVVKEKVQNYIDENEQHFAKSVVLFATADESVWFAERLQMPVTSEFYWEESPVLDQLKEMQEAFPKTGVVLTQKNKIKLIDAELGRLNDTQMLELDLDTEDWKQHQGPHHADASMGKGGAKSSKQDEFQERFEANRYRWYKNVAPKLDKLAKDYGWKQIYLVGNKDETKDLKEHMNKDIYEMINKNLLDHEEMHVLKEVVS
ncbi:VLRF1 family aeRF1-type release factor [Halobacillus amylolyticus]|uniref:VLRF1 family aeRF1-type release factor n=1 Tax=Halobacillus amylolyticus TaxID=2932259 RepID=A0ABY4HA83_9BACI|nr:VLRF1 family aeRF1-type release factor [Halobacillus amylolyticus]UOR11785.1 VLRF1 family aeRF1-type release factor [Halobacillus amylolyticus]